MHTRRWPLARLFRKRKCLNYELYIKEKYPLERDKGFHTFPHGFPGCMTFECLKCLDSTSRANFTSLRFTLLTNKNQSGILALE